MPKDLVRSYMWRGIAKSNGQYIAIAKDKIAVLDVLMTSAQKKKATKLIRECEAKNYKGC